MKNYIMCGMQFGNEGKGSFIDYLTNRENISAIFRYNGVEADYHTVVTSDGKEHRFNQLGAGMFNLGCHTYIADNMVVDIESLINEMKMFCSTTGVPIEAIQYRVHIYKDCVVTTDYHKAFNRLKRLLTYNECEMAINTAKEHQDIEANYGSSCTIYVHDIYDENATKILKRKFGRLQYHLEMYYLSHQKEIERLLLDQQIDADFRKSVESDIDNIILGDVEARCKEFFELCHSVSFTLYDEWFKWMFLYSPKKCIFDGPSALNYDESLPLHVNIRSVNELNSYVKQFVTGLDNKDETKVIGVARAYYARWGKGVLPTYSQELRQILNTEYNRCMSWNDVVRFGWFDSVLFRYANALNPVDEVYLSSLDELSFQDTIRICTKYIYTGPLDAEFSNFFRFHFEGSGRVVIDDICANTVNRCSYQSIYTTSLINNSKLSDYLEHCIPVYVELPGWRFRIDGVDTASELPTECLAYINELEKHIHRKITVVSVGRTMEDKIKL